MISLKDTYETGTNKKEVCKEVCKEVIFYDIKGNLIQKDMYGKDYFEFKSICDLFVLDLEDRWTSIVYWETVD